MRTDIDRFRAAYGAPPRPAEIRQEPLDCDSGHYARLCDFEGELADAADLGSYTDDIAYQPEVQAELFAHLLPHCLAAWRHDQLNDYATDYTSCAEVLIGALVRRPLLDDCLTPSQAEAVRHFMRDTVLDRIDAQHGLSWPGKRALVFPWIMSVNSYAIVFPDLEQLWRTWWRFETPGQAVAALQYVSCLMYDYGANPILAPPTPKQPHQVPPDIWTSDGQVSREDWRLENILFFIDTVTPTYVEDGLARAARALAGIHNSPIPLQILADFEVQRSLLEHRLAALPHILELPNKIGIKWPTMS